MSCEFQQDAVPKANETSNLKCRCNISCKTSLCLTKCFSIIGEKIYSKPWLFIIYGMMVTIICGIGLINFERVPDSGKIYSLNNNNLYEEYRKTIDNFGITHDMILLIVGETKNVNIIRKEYLPIIANIYNKIYEINVTYNNNKVYNYNDLCIKEDKSNEKSKCQSDSNTFINVFFNNNSSKYTDPYYIENVLNDGEGASLYCGNKQYDNPIYLDEWQTGANTLLITYSLNTTYNDIQYEFQGLFMQFWIENRNLFNGLTIYSITPRQTDEELDEIVARNSPYMGIAFVLMLLYLIFILSDNYKKCNIYFRIYLALSSMISLLFSMIISFGIAAIFNYKANSMVFMIPFLLLGIGVDDDIVIMDYFKQTSIELAECDKDNPSYDESEKYSITLTRSGLSISLTSFCTVVALLVGLFCHIDGIISFSVHAAIAFFSNYILQFLFFYSFLVYDERRIKQNRNCCCPCFVKHDRNKSHQNNEKSQEINIKLFLQNLFVSIFKRPIIRWITIIIFIIITIISGYSIQYLDAGTNVLETMPDTGLSYEFYEIYSCAYSGTQITPFYLIIEETDLSLSINRQNILNAINEIQNMDWCVYNIDNWLEQFILYLEYNLNIDINILSSNKTDFYQHLNLFLDDNNYKRFGGNIIIDNDGMNSIIKTAKINVYGYLNDDYQERWSTKQDSIRICDKYNINGFMYIDGQYSWYVDTVLLSLILRNMIYSLIAVSIVLFIFLEFKVAILTVIIVIMIDINLLGWISLWGIGVDRVVFTLTIMTVGITVDYIIHMNQFYVVEIGKKSYIDSDENILKYVMQNIGSSVFKGAFSTLLGGFMLIFTNSAIFRKFFYIIVGVVIVSAFHALIFIPSVATQFLCLYYDKNQQKTAKIIELNVLNTAKKENKNTSNNKESIITPTT